MSNWWQLRSQLDDAIASECPFCGDLMIREISLPFILPEEDQHVVSWEIKPNVGTQRNIPLPVWFGIQLLNFLCAIYRAFGFCYLCTINTILCSVLCCDISIHFIIFKVTFFLFIFLLAIRFYDCHSKSLYPNFPTVNPVPYCNLVLHQFLIQQSILLCWFSFLTMYTPSFQ